MAFTNAKPRAGDAGLRITHDLGRSDAPVNTLSHSYSQVVRAELAGDDLCTAAGITACGPTPVLALCRQLLAQGLSPDAALVVCRAGTLALRVRSIGVGAKLEVNSHGTDFVRLRARRPASLMRFQDQAATSPHGGTQRKLLERWSDAVESGKGKAAP